MARKDKSPTGYRRTAKSVRGRPKKDEGEVKKYQGTIKFDAALDKALREEQTRRAESGDSDSKATIMRSLIIKGLRDLGHELESEND